MDFTGRFELLEADFGHVCELYGRQDLSLPRLRLATGQNYRGAFTSQIMDGVADIYLREIEALECEF